MCRKRLCDVTAALFNTYRNERLMEVKPATLKRQLGPLRHMFNVARDEWGCRSKKTHSPSSSLKARIRDENGGYVRVNWIV